jgi:GTP:adenosylcobinamide-phosphate guanylyltransferase
VTGDVFGAANELARLASARARAVDGKRIDEAELEEETFITYKEELAVNINTPQDLKTAERLFRQVAS